MTAGADRRSQASNPILVAALEYVNRGWPVLPIEPRGKRPRTKHGHKDATTNLEQIRAWWTRDPEANVGVVTGARSGLLVLDLDGAGGDVALIELGATLPTLTCETARGRHLYFGYEPGLGCRNRFRPGLDVRGEGGYVVVPPSVHETGVVYTWDDDHGMGLSLTPAPIPPRLRAALHEHTPAARLSPPERIVEGERNVRLTQLAGSVAGSAGTYDEVLDQMLTLNAQLCAVPLPQREVEVIVRSIWKRECKARHEDRRPRRRISLRGPYVITTLRWDALQMREPRDLATLGFLLDLVRLVHTNADMPIQTGHGQTRRAWVAAGEAEIAASYLCNRWEVCRARMRRMFARWDDLGLVRLLGARLGKKQRRFRLVEGWVSVDTTLASLRSPCTANLRERLSGCGDKAKQARPTLGADNLRKGAAAKSTSSSRDWEEEEKKGLKWLSISSRLEVLV